MMNTNTLGANTNTGANTNKGVNGMMEFVNLTSVCGLGYRGVCGNEVRTFGKLDKAPITIEGTVCERVKDGLRFGDMIVVGSVAECTRYIETKIRDRRSVLAIPATSPSKLMAMFAMKTSGYGMGLKDADVLVDKTGVATNEYMNIYCAFITLSDELIRDIIVKNYKADSNSANTVEYSSVALNRYIAEKDGMKIRVAMVSAKSITAIYNNMGRIKWTAEAIEMFRRDLSDIYRFYQESIIDSAKKFIDIKFYHFFTNIKCSFLNKWRATTVYVDGNSDNRTINNISVKFERINRDYSKMAEDKRPTVVDTDLITIMQNKLADKMEGFINGCYAEKIVIPSDLESVLKNQADNKGLVHDLINIRRIYSAITISMLEKNEELRDTLADEEEIKDNENANFEEWRNNLSILRKAIYWLGKKYDVSRRDVINACIYVGYLVKKGNSLHDSTFNTESTNTFAQNVLGEEYAAFVNGSTINRPVTKVLAGKPEVGSYMMFVNGIANGNVIVEDSITEVAKIVSLNNKLYAECVREFDCDITLNKKTVYVAVDMFKGRLIDVTKPLTVRFQTGIEKFESSYTNADKQLVTETKTGYGVMQDNSVVGILYVHAAKLGGVLEEALLGREGKITNLMQHVGEYMNLSLVEMTVTKVHDMDSNTKMLSDLLDALNAPTNKEEGINVEDKDDVFVSNGINLNDDDDILGVDDLADMI